MESASSIQTVDEIRNIIYNFGKFISFVQMVSRHPGTRGTRIRESLNLVASIYICIPNTRKDIAIFSNSTILYKKVTSDKARNAALQNSVNKGCIVPIYVYDMEHQDYAKRCMELGLYEITDTNDPKYYTLVRKETFSEGDLDPIEYSFVQ